MLEFRKPGWLLILAFLLVTIGLGSWGLTESSEARYAEIGREMYRSADYLHPTNLGIRHYHKPPVTYYLTSLGYALFGVNEFGARFFLAVAFGLQLLLVFKLALLLFNDRKIALACAVIYFSLPMALLSVRFLTTDAYLNTCALASVYFFVRHRLGKRTWSLYAFYLAWGVGFLTKGPAVLIPVVAFILIWKIARRERISVTLHTFLAGIFCVVLSISWYALVSLDNPNFLNYFIGEQILDRAVSASDLHRAQPIWYYLLLAPAVGLPWLPFAFVAWLRKREPGAKKDSTPGILAFTALFVLGFYSLISSKLVFYILPMAPFVALLAGYYLFKVPQKGLRALGWSLTVLTGLITLAMAALPFIPNLKGPAAAVVGFVVVTGGIAAYLLRHFQPENPNRILGLSAILGVQILLGFALFASANPHTVHTYRELTSKINQLDPERNRALIVYDFWAPSVAFYRDQPFITVKAGEKRLEPEIQFEVDSAYKAHLIDLELPGEEARLIRKITRQKPIFILMSHDSIPETLLQALSGEHSLEMYDKYRIYY